MVSLNPYQQHSRLMMADRIIRNVLGIFSYLSQTHRLWLQGLYIADSNPTLFSPCLTRSRFLECSSAGRPQKAGKSAITAYSPWGQKNSVSRGSGAGASPATSAWTAVSCPSPWGLPARLDTPNGSIRLTVKLYYRVKWGSI